ncbi:HNH endonuclease signature motif containing protein [Sphingomonas aracearum]|uniref:HNH endonuclease n=1 Tax=Sphingomonas aracearum TaxID=2283317 RepID=A0A369VQK1_9SPHN|nr:HNH endonuclease signature motif containing protein [Sphingomonas aracearum]RDE04664.1 HNH endonuclease [Sphingomonas aracearum]
MKGRAILYSAEELTWLEANHLLPIGDYHAAFVRAFERSDVKAGHLHALRKRQGWRTGRTGRFETGREPMNKGQPCPEGKGGRHPNARATQFRKGQRSGVAVRLYKPIGTERLSKEGYLERKIHDGLPLQSRWRGVHLLRWEEINGPVPKGHALKCLDGDRLNTDPSNWCCLPRAVLARLNGGRHKTRLAYDQAAPEVRPTILAMAQLQHGVQAARERIAEEAR